MSLGCEPVALASADQAKKQISKMTTIESMEFGDLWNHPDFIRFLSNTSLNLDSDTFLSKDFIDSDGSFNIFNSREAFSDLMNSWDTSRSMEYAPDNSNSSNTQGPPPHKTFPEEVGAETKTGNDALKSALTSREWLLFGNLGDHVDVPYSAVFTGGADDDVYRADTTSLPVATSPPEYDWHTDFFSQLQHLVPSTKSGAGKPEQEEDAKEADDRRRESLYSDVVDVSGEKEAEALRLREEPKTLAVTGVKATSAAPRKKRKRKQRKKVLPDVYRYVEVQDKDVLLGRGGKSNHHDGNKRYREEVKNLQKWYKNIEDKDEKTDLSQCLVDYVHSYGGRFLEQNKQNTKWYIIPNIVARRKASQALREDNDPVKRAAKRARHLKKKAEEEKKKQKKGR